MLVAKMPHVHWDSDSQRFICRRRVPIELQSILGKKPRVHKFKKGVDQKTANDLSLVILGQWQAEFDAVRMQINAPSTTRTVGPYRDSFAVTTIIRQPGEALEVGGRNVRLIRSRPDDKDMLVEYVVADRPKPAPVVASRCTTETAIGLWRVKRGDDQPKQQALDTRRSKMRKFLAWHPN